MMQAGNNEEHEDLTKSFERDIKFHERAAERLEEDARRHRKSAERARHGLEYLRNTNV